MNWLAPWQPVERSEAAGLEEQLRREMPRGHLLRGTEPRAIARRCDCDDVLFGLRSSDRVAVVHLTWSSRPERDHAWPWAIVYASLREFEVECMQRDHAEYQCGAD